MTYALVETRKYEVEAKFATQKEADLAAIKMLRNADRWAHRLACIVVADDDARKYLTEEDAWTEYRWSPGTRSVVIERKKRL